MTDMRAILATLALAIVLRAAPAIGSAPNAVQPLIVTRTSGTTTATCTLIHRDDQADRVVLYFMTAGSVFKTAEGERLPVAESIVVGRGSEAITILPQDVLLPTGNFVDLALLRATVSQADLQPQPISWEPPPPGDSFVVVGINRIGTTAEIGQHVRFASTMLVAGDRGVAELDGCIGTPATASAGVFGVVTSCDDGRAPFVTLLGLARPFISHYILGLAAAPTISHLSMFDREVAGPAVDIPCIGLAAGEIAVPVPLARNERILDVVPSLIHSKEVHVADISVIHVGDSFVKLRFSVAGGSPPSWTLECPQPQALITLRMTLVRTVRE